jgi:hypothetical protein
MASPPTSWKFVNTFVKLPKNPALTTNMSKLGIKPATTQDIIDFYTNEPKTPDPFGTDRASKNLCLTPALNGELMSTCSACNDTREQYKCKYRSQASQAPGCMHLRFGEFCDSLAAQKNEDLPEPSTTDLIQVDLDLADIELRTIAGKYKLRYGVWDKHNSMFITGVAGTKDDMQKYIDNLVANHPGISNKYEVMERT